jgi:hypothetical protein
LLQDKTDSAASSEGNKMISKQTGTEV